MQHYCNKGGSSLKMNDLLLLQGSSQTTSKLETLRHLDKTVISFLAESYMSSLA